MRAALAAGAWDAWVARGAAPHPPSPPPALSLQYYSPASSCSLNIFFITWNIVLFLAYAAISVSPLRSPSAGLLTSAAVFAYTTYYTWSALNSEPAGECKALDTAGNKVIQARRGGGGGRG